MAITLAFTKEANDNVKLATTDTVTGDVWYQSFTMLNYAGLRLDPVAKTITIESRGDNDVTFTYDQVTTPAATGSLYNLWNELQTNYFFKPPISISGTLTGANNGLSVSGTDAQLGGTLLANTTINTNTKTLNITGGNVNISNGANNLAITATTGTVSTNVTNATDSAIITHTNAGVTTVVTDGATTTTQTNGSTDITHTVTDGVVTNTITQSTNGTSFSISVALPITNPAIAADTTLNATHYTVLVDATAANRTITLPAAAGCSGRIYNIKKIDATANTVTIDADGAETIDGAANKVISAQWTNITIQSNGTAWFIL